MAHGKLRAAETLSQAGQYADALSPLYYAAFHGAKAALADFNTQSKKHKTWLSELNKRFGQGQGWLPKSYCKLVSGLSKMRAESDYQGTIPNDKVGFHKLSRRVALMLKRIRSEAPLCNYPEFIHELLSRLGEDVRAIEADYYCPRSYPHKERVQLQLQASILGTRFELKARGAGREAIKRLGASRKKDYVLGWNSRLGQTGERFLLFLDIDDTDLGKVKSALRRRRGWLFESGNGYHFIGKTVLRSRDAWESALCGLSATTKELVDDRYIHYSLARGYSTLRMTTSDLKPVTPFLCWDNT